MCVSSGWQNRDIIIVSGNLIFKKLSKGQIRHHVEIPNPCVDDLASGSTDSHSPLTFMPLLKNTPKYDYQ